MKADHLSSRALLPRKMKILSLSVLNTRLSASGNRNSAEGPPPSPQHHSNRVDTLTLYSPFNPPPSAILHFCVDFFLTPFLPSVLPSFLPSLSFTPSLSLSLAVDYFWSAWLISVGSQAQCQRKWSACKKRGEKPKRQERHQIFFPHLKKKRKHPPKSVVK